MKTDPKWVENVVSGNLEEILTDHAYCEQKATSSAISLIVLFPEHEEIVQEMTALAIEEMGHFQMVHKELMKRGYKLGWERKDSYVNELAKFIKGRGNGREAFLLNKLLFAAMIEARSCERFKVLSDHLKDEELAKFYHELMISEARHYTLFLRLARKYCPNMDVDKHWEEFLEYEAKVISNYGTKEHVHG